MYDPLRKEEYKKKTEIIKTERHLSVFKAKAMYLPIKVYGSLGKVLDFCEKMQLGTEGH